MSMAVIDEYFGKLIAQIKQVQASQAHSMAQAVDLILEAARQDKRVFVFGTGHSHMLAEEVHYRAGGLAITVPVLSAMTMLHEGAYSSTQFERISGLVQPLLERYGIGAGDVLIVVSNSGVNAAPIEAARFGRDQGAAIIALTSVAYSLQAANGRVRLAELADIVLDNQIPAGDALVQLPGSEMKAGAVSTAIGATILNAVLTAVAAELSRDGGDVPVYRSANMPGAADINARLVEKYKARNPHL
ncbi:hypothetical protein MP213Fo_23640 [Pseudochrobactrum sp. MP213Fo]